MLTAVLFLIIKNWKQAKYPSTRELIDKLQSINFVEFQTAKTNKSQSTATCNNMDQPHRHHNE